MAVLEIDIQIDPSGELKIRKLKQATDDLSSSASKTSSVATASFKNVGLAATAAVASVGLLAKQALDMADDFKLMEGRLKLVTKSSEELATAQQSLYNIAQNTRQSLKATTDLYTSLARSTQALGKSQKDTLAITETINKAIIVSGASASSAQAALVQLGQGFAAGTLRGDELNSVLEQTPRIAEAIAKGMGITVGQLRSLGAEGKLTGEAVFEALKSQAKAVDEEFSRMPKTVSQASEQMGNSLLKLVGHLDKTSGASNALSNAISGISKAMDAFSRGLELDNLPIDNIEILNEKLNRLGAEWSDLEKRKNLSIFSWDWLPEDAIIKKQKEIEGLISLLVTGKEGLYKLADDKRLLESEILGDRFSYTISPERQKEIDERIFDMQKDAQDKKLELAKKHSEEIKKLAKETAEFETEQFALAAINSEKSFKQLDAVKDFLEVKKEADTLATKSIREMQDAMITYYDAIGDSQSAYYAKEAKLIEELKDTKLLTEKQINEIIAKNREKFREEQFEKENKWLYDMFDNINKALDESFFDTMTGKFKSFGDWLKDFFTSIGSSIARGLSRTLAGSITDSLQKSIIGSLRGTSSFGGLSALAIGSTVSASEIGSLMNSGGVFDSATNSIKTSGGSVIKLGADGSGTLSSGGSDILSLASNISSLNTAYNLISNGLSSTVMSGFSGLSNLTGISGISQFGYGFTNPFAATNPLAGLYGSGVPELSGLSSIGSTAGGMALGGLGGYALGSLGDKLFGANTKASSLGAVGGTIGSFFGPIGTVVGAVLGSVIGGMMGSTKQTDAGLSFGSVTGMGQGFDDIKAYADMKKKSWFSSKSWTNYTELSASEVKQIKGIFDTYDYLLAQLGDTDRIILEAGKYTGQSFQDAVAKKFIEAFTDVSQTTDDTIYQAWVTYAESIDSTVIEALSASINTFITSTRTFDVWALNRSGQGIEALAQQAKWAQEDFSNLSNMLGVTGVTVENYTQMYKEAVKNSLTPETITQWQSLGTALMTATNAADAYNETLKAQQESQYQTALTSLNSIYAINVQILALQIQKALVEQGISQENLNALEAQKSGIETIIGMAQRMRDRLLTADTIAEAYSSVLSGAKSDFASGNYSSANIIRLGEISSTYADYLKETSISENDYKFGVLKIAGEIESITNGGQATLDTLQSEIERVTSALDALTPTIDDQLDALYAQRDVYVTQTEKEIATLRELLGASSPMVQMLQVALASAKTGSIAGTSISGSTLTGTLASVADIYSKYDLNQYQTDTSGYEYWVNQVNSGAIAPSQLESAIKNSAEQILGKPLGFADGGIVTSKTNAIIGEAGYPEAVIPLKDGAGLKVDMGGAFEVLEKRLARSEALQEKMAKDMAKMTRVFEMADDNGAIIVKVAV